MSRSGADWEAIEREYRAGQLSIREIARQHGITETAIRKRATSRSWERLLVEKVSIAVREKLLRTSREGSQEQHESDQQTVEAAAQRGFEVVTSHRKDLTQLHGLKRILATRLAEYLDGGKPDGPFMGEKESPGDLLEKLSRVNSRLIPLERQAFSLDTAPDDPNVAQTVSPDRRRAAMALLLGRSE